MLGIQHCSVSRVPKIDTLDEICRKLAIAHNEVAIIGDDINDLSLIRAVGLSFCPADAVVEVKNAVDIVLSKKGGNGCVRELIDDYILDQPLTK